MKLGDKILLKMKHFLFLLVHVWLQVPNDGEQPLFSFTLPSNKGSLYSDGEHLSVTTDNRLLIYSIEDLGENPTPMEIEDFGWSATATTSA